MNRRSPCSVVCIGISRTGSPLRVTQIGKEELHQHNDRILQCNAASIRTCMASSFGALGPFLVRYQILHSHMIQRAMPSSSSFLAYRRVLRVARKVVFSIAYRCDCVCSSGVGIVWLFEKRGKHAAILEEIGCGYSKGLLKIQDVAKSFAWQSQGTEYDGIP